MRILFDHNLPRRLRLHLSPHECTTTRQIRCEFLTNGKLLLAARDKGADLFLTVDKKLEHEQNLRSMPLSVIVLDALGNKLEDLLPFTPHLLRHLAAGPLPVALHVLSADGTLLRLDQPRPRK